MFFLTQKAILSLILHSVQLEDAIYYMSSILVITNHEKYSRSLSKNKVVKLKKK